MKGSEFLRRIRRLGRKQGMAVKLVERRGKGSHATLFFGDKYTILKDRKKEIGLGLLNRMLRDLGLTRDDLNQGGMP
jgi:predicted RNA binding protein YcfA (HicA-like mRNA interferase family)